MTAELSVTPEFEGCSLRDAHERVETELSRMDEKRAALERFESAVESVEAVAPVATQVSTGETLIGSRGDSGTGRRRVRRAFETHVRPLSGDALETPETVYEAIETEFSRDVAVALATEGASPGLPSPLKRAVLSASSRRRTELTLMTRTLERERESLEAVKASTTTVQEWLDAHNEVSLLGLDFEALDTWHRRLEHHRTTLDDAAAQRQEHIGGCTGRDATVALRHRTLVDYLYTEFPVTFPALDACATLAAACATAQRAIRDHLVRRV